MTHGKIPDQTDHQAPAGARVGAYWRLMRPSRAARRPHLPTSPFEPPPPAPPAKEFGVGDQVTHDKYGLGRVTEVEGNAVLVDFGTRTVRIPAPYAKLFVL